MNRRRRILVTIMMCLLGAVALFCFQYMTGKRQAAIAALSDVKTCRRYAAGIKRIRRRPAVASEHEEVSEEIARLVERYAKSDGIPADRLIRFSPSPPRRLGETAYMEKCTQILLKNVTLKQLVKLVHDVVSTERRLRAKSIRLSAPDRNDTTDRWTVELTLSYLIYNPPQRGGK